MNIPKDMADNMLLDLSKKEIDIIARSDFIKSYMQEYKISFRELSKKINVPIGTLHEWVTMNKAIKHKKYIGEELLKNIDNIKVDIDNYNISEIQTLTKVHNQIDVLSDRLTFLLSQKFKKSDKTIKLLENLREEINKILILKK